MPVRDGKVSGRWVGGRCSENTPGIGRMEVQNSSKLFGWFCASVGQKMQRLNRQTCKHPGNINAPALGRSCGELKSGLKYCETLTSPVTNHSP